MCRRPAAQATCQYVLALLNTVLSWTLDINFLDMVGKVLLAMMQVDWQGVN